MAPAGSNVKDVTEQDSPRTLVMKKSSRGHRVRPVADLGNATAHPAEGLVASRVPETSACRAALPLRPNHSFKRRFKNWLRSMRVIIGSSQPNLKSRLIQTLGRTNRLPALLNRSEFLSILSHTIAWFPLEQ